MDEAQSADGPAGGVENLTRATMRGVKWTYLSTVLGTSMQLVFAAVMGRLLTPADFGLLAVGQLVIQFANFLAQMGLANALIQKPGKVTQRDERAAFTSSLILGATVWLLLFVLAAPIADGIFSKPEATVVLQLLGASLFVQALGSTSSGLLRRRLDFRTHAIAHMGSYFVGYLVVGVALGFAGLGVGALVAAVIVQQSVSFLYSFAKAKHAFALLFSADAYRELWSFGSRSSLNNFFGYIGQNLDNFTVAAFLPDRALGLYDRSYLLARLPMYKLTTALVQVLFPSLSAIQDDKARLQRSYTSAVGFAVVVCFPICAGIAVAGREIALTVLGPQWEAAGELIPWLVIASAASVVSSFSIILFEAKAELNWKIGLSVAQVTVFAGLLTFVVMTDPTWLAGYALALAGSEVFLAIAYAFVVARVIDLPWSPLLARLASATAAAVVVAAVCFGIEYMTADVLPIALVLAIETVGGAAALLGLFRTPLLFVARDDIRERLGHSGAVQSGSRAEKILQLVGVSRRDTNVENK